MVLFLDGGNVKTIKLKDGFENTLSYNEHLSFNNFGAILSKSIQSAINSVVIIGGFVVLFSVIISMLNSSKILYILCNIFNPLLSILKIPATYAPGIITGIIEVTNGVKDVALGTNLYTILICSFLIGFGGISVLLQVLSITSKAKISIKPYILGKIIQAVFSVIFICIFSICL